MSTTKIRLSQLKLGGVNTVGNNQVDHIINYALQPNDTSNSLTNLGATTPVIFTLPDVTLFFGKAFLIVKLASQNIVVRATLGATIVDSVANGVIQNTTASEVHSYVRLASIKTGVSSGTWIINDSFGTWTTL